MSQFDDIDESAATVAAWAAINEEANAILHATRAGQLPREERLKRLTTLCRDLALYRHLAGYDALIERLTNSIFHEEFTSNDLWKRIRDEYPFLSQRQMDRRLSYEVGDALINVTDVNGALHTGKFTRPRSEREQLGIERHVWGDFQRTVHSSESERKAHKARVKRYRDFVNGKADVPVWRKFTITDGIDGLDGGV